MRWGLSLGEVEDLWNNADPRLFRTMLEEVFNLEEVERLTLKLDIAQAFNAAYVGSQPKSQRGFIRFQNQILRDIGKLQRRNRRTVWDNLTRKSRAL